MRPVILTVLGLVTLALAVPVAQPPRVETDVEATDRLIFNSTMAEFFQARAAKTPVNLDWTSDGCSSADDDPFRFKFLPSCTRHDFAYRNYKNQSRFHHDTRKRIDKNFKKDLYQQCEIERAEHLCKMTANIYYDAVRAFGNTRAAQDVKEVKLAVDALKALEEQEGKA